MTLDLLSLPETAETLPGDLRWLEEVLACACCRHQSRLPCRHIQTGFCLRNGIVYPADQEQSDHLSEQQKFCESLEKARGTYELPLERVLQMPEDEETRTVLDWLRALLREGGQRRILQLQARRGWAARALAQDGHQVVATDFLDDPHLGLGCAVLLRAHGGQGFACVRAGPTALPFRPETFDGVFCFDTLGQIPDLERAFQEIARVLRPGGLFVALQEPFRGVLTAQTERLLDTAFYRLARWWLPGTLAGTAQPELAYLGARLGASLHGVRRRVPFCLAAAAAAGLQTIVLPTAVALSLSPRLQPQAAPDGKAPAWLAALAQAYALDIDRLQARIDLARQVLRYDLIRQLLRHWLLVGNIEGMLLARKGTDELLPFQELQPGDAERCRRFDPLLLACAADGFLPLYGVYRAQLEGPERYCWLQPRAGLIVPAGPSLEITLSCPPEPFTIGPVRIDLRLETERLPVAVVVLSPGQKATLKIPIPASVVRQASLFVSLTANWGFLPSDLSPGPGGDTRLLAIRLHALRAP